MSGTRGGLGRRVAMGIGLAVALALLGAGEARAGFYSVAQCGWSVGADADWWDSTGGAKFRSDAFCAPGAGDGGHLKSLTREDQGTVTGGRFARWRWVAPPTTNIRQVRGTWWRALHDGLEQRFGGATLGGGFEPALSAANIDTTPREFLATFTPSMPAVEDRLLCARADSKWCSLEPSSWSGLRTLNIVVDDGVPPGAWISGGDLTDGGWRRGSQFVAFGGYDAGSGVRFGETLLDGGRVGGTAYPCAQAMIDGEWRGTRMQPCLPEVSGTHTVDTARFSDGLHVLRHCVSDFAANVACAPERTVAIDNNPPAGPRSMSLAGGEGWHRSDDFDLIWLNPDQGPASRIGAALWRIAGPAGFDSGVQLALGRGISALPDRRVPAAGAYSLQLWLRDEAGNDAPSSAVVVPLRFDDVPPGVAFAAGGDDPGELRAAVADRHSGPAAGGISYRRLNGGEWTGLPTRLQGGDDPGRALLLARMPDLAAGTYVFRADAVDAAGNATTTTLRADGTEMTIRRDPAAVAPKKAVAAAPPRAKARLFARLRGGHGHGDALTVPFAAAATVSGRLTRADGAGAADRELRVVARPSHGALAPVSTSTVSTGERGGFELRLGPGPSRRIAVSFGGDGGLEPAVRPSLELRVRTGISLRAAPLSLRGPGRRCG